MLQTAADTTVAVLHAPAAAGPDALEQAMLAGDKLPVVLAVVLVVWAGLLVLLVTTERRLARVERRLDAAEADAARAARP